MNWGSDERYTLEEAERELARRRCAANGHRYEIVSLVQHDGPERLVCSRCGKSWKVEPEAPS